MIEVRLFAFLRRNREKIYKYESGRFQNAGEIIDFLDINREEVAILLINGRHSKPEDTVKDGDVVSLFPPVGGG